LLDIAIAAIDAIDAFTLMIFRYAASLRYMHAAVAAMLRRCH